MPNLADVYMRTLQGRATAFNPGAELPASLKTLLKAVDGKTTTSALEAAYTELGDVASLLAILLGKGLIADRGESSAKTSFALDPADSPPWVNSNNALLDSSFGDFGTSTFSQFAVPQPKKPD
jgi:hypothetical protein